jgi:hypothetical protein
MATVGMIRSRSENDVEVEPPGCAQQVAFLEDGIEDAQEIEICPIDIHGFVSLAIHRIVARLPRPCIAYCSLHSCRQFTAEPLFAMRPCADAIGLQRCVVELILLSSFLSKCRLETRTAALQPEQVAAASKPTLDAFSVDLAASTSRCPSVPSVLEWPR